MLPHSFTSDCAGQSEAFARYTSPREGLHARQAKHYG